MVSWMVRLKQNSSGPENQDNEVKEAIRAHWADEELWVPTPYGLANTLHTNPFHYKAFMFKVHGYKVTDCQLGPLLEQSRLVISSISPVSIWGQIDWTCSSCIQWCWYLTQLLILPRPQGQNTNQIKLANFLLTRLGLELGWENRERKEQSVGRQAGRE